MASSTRKINLYKIKVTGVCVCPHWNGYFIEEPDTQMIRDAILEDVLELEAEVDDLDCQETAGEFRSLMEVVQYSPDDWIQSQVYVAGVLVGNISLIAEEAFTFKEG